jgi:hypothetical protein
MSTNVDRHALAGTGAAGELPGTCARGGAPMPRDGRPRASVPGASVPGRVPGAGAAGPVPRRAAGHRGVEGESGSGTAALRDGESDGGIGTGEGSRVSELDRSGMSDMRNREDEGYRTAPTDTVSPYRDTRRDTDHMATKTTTYPPGYFTLVHRAFRAERGPWADGSAKAKTEGRTFAHVLRLLVRGYVNGTIKV